MQHLFKKGIGRFVYLYFDITRKAVCHQLQPSPLLTLVQLFFCEAELFLAGTCSMQDIGGPAHSVVVGSNLEFLP